MITKNKVLIIFAVLIVLTVGAGVIYRENLLKVADDFNKNLEKLQKTDFGDILNEVAREITTPPPLNVGGKENQIVFTRAKIIAQTNIQRYNNGTLLPLIENAKLNAVAEAKAKDMFSNQYFEHISPTGVDPGTLAKKFGYDYIIEGENLILGNFKSEQEIVQHWMDSPGHRANILHDRFTEIGVAIIKGTYQGQTAWIGVQEFGLPLLACDQPNVAMKNKIDSNKIEIDQLLIAVNNKKSEIDNTNPKSPKYNALVDEYNSLVAKYNTLVKETKNLIVQYNNQINTFNQCVIGQ